MVTGTQPFESVTTRLQFARIEHSFNRRKHFAFASSILHPDRNRPVDPRLRARRTDLYFFL